MDDAAEHDVMGRIHEEKHVNTTKSLRIRKSDLGRRIGPTAAAELEYFCRGCKGHFTRVVPVEQLSRTTCRCGSSDLLVYAIAGEYSAPLRSH